jgi:hypothetical protein
MTEFSPAAQVMSLYHVSAMINVGVGTAWHDGMYMLPEPNLADGWLPRLRELIHDDVSIQTGRQFAVNDVTIISISPL